LANDAKVRQAVLILANPLAGPFSGRRRVRQLVTALSRLGLTPHVCHSPVELSQRFQEMRDQVRCVVSAGGDGTLAEVSNRVPEAPVAILALGNENLVARHFGIPKSGRRLAELIAQGNFRRYDLGRANGRLFTLMAGAGFDAEVVHLVHQRRGHVGKASYLWPLVRTAWTYRFPPITVDIEDTGERLTGAHVLLFNLPRYGLGLPIAPEADPTDGWLDLCVLRRPGLGPLCGYLWALARKRSKGLDIERRLVRRVRLSSSEPAALQVDGDPAGQLPATMEIVDQAMNLLVPESPDHQRRHAAGRLGG
jgi:diacylglycerol kinase (ATP)